MPFGLYTHRNDIFVTKDNLHQKAYPTHFVVYAELLECMNR